MTDHNPFRIAERHALEALTSRHVTHAELWAALDPIVARGDFEVVEVGRSIQGRPLRTIGYGRGPIEVLLWSQMHGDEATATRALADLLAFLAGGGGEDDRLHGLITDRLRLTLLPLVNPDGAELPQRENAVGIDLNRDAVRRASPEAQALGQLRDRVKPVFGFNLHDQDVRRTAGPGGLQVALALLAPPAGPELGYGPPRQRARLLAARVAEGLAEEIPGRVARWDDSWEPRAFGERMQESGTSTVLVESGALPDDPEKERLRRVTCGALLGALGAIAGDLVDGSDPEPYDALPDNVLVDHDLHLLGGIVRRGPEDPGTRADVALVWADPVARKGLRLVEVGELGEATTLEVAEYPGCHLDIEGPVTLGPGAAVTITVRRDESDGGVVARYR